MDVIAEKASKQKGNYSHNKDIENEYKFSPGQNRYSPSHISGRFVKIINI
jgi:hypothetical protein